VKYYLIIFLSLLSTLLSQDIIGNRLMSNNFLGENPIYPIPQEMTFEEYVDMNRRLSVGLLLAAVPFPGTIHNYAGEVESAKKIRWIAVGSTLSIFAGIISINEGENWQESSYPIHIINQGEDDEKRFEMIPISISGSEVDYKLKEIHKESEWTASSMLLPLGVSMLIGSYLYDYINGIKIIENKRDKVRFKYGKKLDFSFQPVYDYKANYTGLTFSYKF